MVSACLHKSKGFVQTPGHRWRATKEAPKDPPKKRRPFKQVVAEVMGKRTMRAKEVVGILQSKGLMPKSKRPSHYMNVTLANNTDTFERVDVGQYRVI